MNKEQVKAMLLAEVEKYVAELAVNELGNVEMVEDKGVKYLFKDFSIYLTE
jgi:hypothetical protein